MTDPTMTALYDTERIDENGGAGRKIPVAASSNPSCGFGKKKGRSRNARELECLRKVALEKEVSRTRRQGKTPLGNNLKAVKFVTCDDRPKRDFLLLYLRGRPIMTHESRASRTRACETYPQPPPLSRGRSRGRIAPKPIHTQDR